MVVEKSRELVEGGNCSNTKEIFEAGVVEGVGEHDEVVDVVGGEVVCRRRN